MKKISVIIPCHNAVKWLPKCFLSLVSQTIEISNIELIFADDASDDEGATWEMLQEFERAYPEDILILHLEENMRQGGARNAAFPYATGEYLAFVDADDFVTEDFLEKTYKKAKETNADILQFEYFYYTDRLGAVPTNRRITPAVFQIHTPEERKTFLLSEKITYGCWNKLYRRELVQQAGVQYAEHVIYEEPLFVYPLLFYGNKFVITDEVFYFYRQNDGGTMRSDMKQFETLKMHMSVQLSLWHFMKQTPFFTEYYEEIKLYFLHSYFYETLYFARQRDFSIPWELYLELETTVRKEVPGFSTSIYETVIPLQMELYRLAESGMDKETLQAFLAKI